MSNAKPVTYLEAVAVLELEKQWGGNQKIQWIAKSQRKFPSGYDSRIAVIANNVFAEGLFVELYFKEATLPGVPDKFNASLMHRSTRICGLDTGAFAGHTNTVGKNREHYQETVGMPHLHTPSEDAVYGYAEPLPNLSLEELWEIFLEKAKIKDAPKLTLPNEGQTGILL